MADMTGKTLLPLVVRIGDETIEAGTVEIQVPIQSVEIDDAGRIVAVMKGN